MTAFSSDVYKSTEEQPVSDLTNYTDYLKKRAKAAQEWEGSATAYKPQTSLADDLAAQDKYKSGEFARRTGAAGQEMDLAKAEDTRTASIADRVKQALYDRTQAQQAVETAGTQQNLTAYQQAQESQQGWEQATKKQNFTQYTNAADRYAAMKDAYTQGIAEYQILQANRDGALTIADLDRYYAVQKNKIDNAFKDTEALAKMNMEEFIQSLEIEARNNGTIIDGLFSGLAAYIPSLFKKG